MVSSSMVDRRAVLRSLAAMGSAALLPSLAAAAERPPLTKRIPSSGEALPLVGLGTWITFNVGDDPAAREACTAVMRAFFAAGGRLIDSSPMYASSHAVVGYALAKLGRPPVFSAEKVWTSGSRGRAQIEETRKAWGVERFDLLQVHNIYDWEEHMPLLQAMKRAGQLRYVGITTSEGRRHREFERIMRTQTLDFVQVTYNPVDREAEARILPAARERGIGVLVNRPFQQGALVRRLARRPLPEWAAEIGATSWAQLILKFIVSHPAVTCAIPATTRVDHVRENLAAAAAPLPDEAMRRRIAALFAAL
ncbi:MAG: aldo/keto reductase [Rhodospirillaceae bacterium]|nr:aldo/keto reductase [Rhodospirillaceae bacterium]